MDRIGVKLSKDEGLGKRIQYTQSFRKHPFFDSTHCVHLQNPPPHPFLYALGCRSTSRGLVFGGKPAAGPWPKYHPWMLDFCTSIMSTKGFIKWCFMWVNATVNLENVAVAIAESMMLWCSIEAVNQYLFIIFIYQKKHQWIREHPCDFWS